MIVPEDACSTMNADWHAASIGYALQNVAIVTRTDEVIAALGTAAPAAGTAPTAGSGSAEAANEAIRRRMRERRERGDGGR